MAIAGVAVGSVASLASAPLASGALERLLDRRPLSRWWMIAATIGIVGATLLCAAEVGGAELSDVGPSGSGHDGGAGTALHTLAGIGLGLIAGASYASYSWVVHRLMAGGIRRSASMGAVFGTGGALLMPVLLVTGAPILESRESFFIAAYMALVPMFLGYVLFGFGLTRVAPSTATTITLTEPAVASVLAVVIVGEALTPVGWAGLACIAVVLLILAVAPANAVPPRRHDEMRAPA
ncbi:EamA family transporter [Zhihengliuella flava]|uniref:Drug/metabolite transporter (DMT)-like permease n=1 Tax=Zhihengliuella flava TaxID=1285193 RepID=A0A931DDR0_9MICC|nr:drug/metabolite transporter (DMT)-like permease [Zhihengliuella flava]